jgi:hypothetical protein
MEQEEELAALKNPQEEKTVAHEKRWKTHLVSS